VAHVHKMFMLAGETEAQAAKDAETVLALETRLAKASLTVTEQRDPQNLNHPIDVLPSSKELPHFALADYVAAAHAPAAGKANDMEPKFFAEFNTLVADTPIEQVDVSPLAFAACLRRHQAYRRASTKRTGTSIRTS